MYFDTDFSIDNIGNSCFLSSLQLCIRMGIFWQISESDIKFIFRFPL